MEFKKIIGESGAILVHYMMGSLKVCSNSSFKLKLQKLIEGNNWKELEWWELEVSKSVLI